MYNGRIFASQPVKWLKNLLTESSSHNFHEDKMYMHSKIGKQMQASMKITQNQTFSLILRILQLNQAMATLMLNNFLCASSFLF